MWVSVQSECISADWSVPARDQGRAAAIGAAEAFAGVLAAVDRTARREQRTLPSEDEYDRVHTGFWAHVVPALAGVSRELDGTELREMQAEVQAILNPWFLRSRFWARSWIKPHGYAGDFLVLEWMYDLEANGCADPTQPAIVNLLDSLFRSVHSVQAVWDRRAWFAGVIGEMLYRERRRPIRVLDVACGGSRYLRDVISSCGPGAISATFVDQDAAALSFVRSWLAALGVGQAQLVCAPVRSLAERVAADDPDRAFDVVISTGLFDYLSEESARALLAHMYALVRPGGTVAICNFAPTDRSRLVKDWISDWRLIYRSSEALAALFPSGVQPRLSVSPDGGLVYARATA
jgi:SAM-dependent methyltransferase